MTGRGEDADGHRTSHTPEPPHWIDELELRPAPPHHRMGTRALDLEQWFVVDERRDVELAMRRRLLAERTDDVFGVLPPAEDACEEVLELVRAWTIAHGVATEGPPDGTHPVATAGLLVQDDLCLMVRRDGRWHLDAAMLCFPSMWVLAEKLGHPVGAIHAPVDHYDDDLGGRVDSFFDRFRVERPVWRRNLSIKATDELFLPSSKLSPGPPPTEPLVDGSQAWMRSERQTLRKLPRTGAILFTIRVQLAPVSVLRHRPDRAEALLAMIDSWDDAMRDFKDAATLDVLASWLRTVAPNHDVND